MVHQHQCWPEGQTGLGTRIPPRRSARRFRLLCTFVAATSLAACGGGSSGSTPATPSAAATSTFQGVIAGSGGQGGTVALTIQAQVGASSAVVFQLPFIATLHAQATTVGASGSVHVAGGSTIALSGTFDSSTKALSLSGGGFTFTGTLVGPVVSGTYTGPGAATGGFSSQSTASGTVTAYCGTFVTTGNAIGVFNLSVSASGAVSGVAHATIGGTPGIQYFSGQVTGTTITLNTEGAPGGDRGTIQNGTITGITGRPWSGSTSACQ